MSVDFSEHFIGEDLFVTRCIDQSQNADPAQRVFARLQRDLVLAVSREMKGGAQPSDVIDGASQAMSAAVVNLVGNFCMPGHESALLDIIVQRIGARAHELLSSLGVAGQEDAGDQAGE